MRLLSYLHLVLPGRSCRLLHCNVGTLAMMHLLSQLLCWLPHLLLLSSYLLLCCLRNLPWLSINVNSTEQKSVFCLASHTLMFNVIGLASTSSQLKIIAELLYDGTHFCIACIVFCYCCTQACSFEVVLFCDSCPHWELSVECKHQRILRCTVVEWASLSKSIAHNLPGRSASLLNSSSNSMALVLFVYYHKCAVAVCHVSTSVCYFPLYFVYAVLCIQYKCWYFQYPPLAVGATYLSLIPFWFVSLLMLLSVVGKKLEYSRSTVPLPHKSTNTCHFNQPFALHPPPSVAVCFQVYCSFTVTIWILWIWIRCKHLILTCQYWFLVILELVVFNIWTFLFACTPVDVVVRYSPFLTYSVFKQECVDVDVLSDYITWAALYFWLITALMSSSLKSHGASNTLLLGGVTTNVLGNAFTVIVW